MSLLRVTTASGGVYEVDVDRHLFRKAKTTPGSLVEAFGIAHYKALSTRPDFFTPFEEADTVHVGDQMFFGGTSVPDTDWVLTSPATKVEEVEA